VGNGFTGQGAVIGGQDTGYQWTHPALKNKYRGWDGVSADHNYSWHDAIHTDLNGDFNNPCGYDSPVPCDDGDHGTHTMGTMSGDEAQATRVGMAPGQNGSAAAIWRKALARPRLILNAMNGSSPQRPE